MGVLLKLIFLSSYIGRHRVEGGALFAGVVGEGGRVGGRSNPLPPAPGTG